MNSDRFQSRHGCAAHLTQPDPITVFASETLTRGNGCHRWYARAVVESKMTEECDACIDESPYFATKRQALDYMRARFPHARVIA